MEFHFLDVGIGNMTLMITPGGTVIMYDCNITQDNESGVMAHVGSVIGRRRPIDVFINSHRDADHMRGIGILNDAHPIQKIQDTGVPGTTTDSPEYEEYMDLLRQLPITDPGRRRYSRSTVLPISNRRYCWRHIMARVHSLTILAMRNPTTRHISKRLLPP